MLHLKDKTKKKIAGLVDYKDLYIEKILESGDQLLSFSYPKKSKYYFDIEEECYINTKENEFIIKEKNVGSEYTTFKCVLNLEDLEGKPWERYESVEQPIDKALALALAGTGWIVGKCTLKKKRTVRATNCSSLEVIKNIRKTYRCDLVFNTLTRTIDVYEHLGDDKGAYFIDSLNLKELSIQGNSYDFFTRIIPIGKDDLRITSINDGKEYVENYQYSNKIKTIYWKDDRYTIVENLKEDAEAKLNEISKPYRAYSANILNLAKLNDKYKEILDYKLGDTITLISKDNKFRDKQRIVKIKEYPDEHELDSVELANTTLTFEEMQTQFQEAADTVDNITTDNGTINGETIDSIKTEQISDFEASVSKITDLTAVNAKIHNLEAFNVSITGRLTAVEADIGILNANVGVIDKLTVTHTAQINNLIATKADITDLNAVNATIQVLEAQTAKIETLLNGNLSSENIQAGGITSDKLSISNGFIKNAMIDSLDVSKVNAGDISTNKFKIKSDDGGIEIVGATQQFKDKNNKVRIQMGKDTQGNFNFIIRGEDGTSTLIDHTGVKEKAIADDLIKSNMIASDAVGEKQIDYNSFSKGFNKDTNTTTLKATKIKLDNQNQTLDIAFNQLKTQADGTKSLTESNSTTIGIMQGQISAAINNTTITKDGQTILLKDDYNRTVATVDSMKSTIGSHTTQIDSATGKINNVETKVNTVERNLNSITARVSSTETNITTIRDAANNANNKIDNLQVGVRNLLTNKILQDFASNGVSKNSDGSYNLVASTDVAYFQHDCVLDNQSTGSEFTFSVEIKYVKGTKAKRFRITIWHDSHWDDYYISNEITDNFKLFSKTVKLKANSRIGLCVQIDDTNIPGSTYMFRNLKLETGNRATGWSPAPEDTEKAINDIDIKISTTNNKVASIETNLSSITSRVSSVETTNANINGQVSNLSSRLNVAEQKITDSSIVDIVKNSKTNGKNTFVQGTELQQTVNEFNYKFENIGNENVIKNAWFLGGLTHWEKSTWSNGDSSNISISIDHTTGNPLDNWLPLGIDYIKVSNTGNLNNRHWGGIQQVIKVEPGEKYTLSYYVAGHRINRSIIEIKRGDNSKWLGDASISDIKSSKEHGAKLEEDFTFIKYTFTVPTDCPSIRICLWSEGRQAGGGASYAWFTKVQVERGEVATSRRLSSNEISNNSTTIDEIGVKVKSVKQSQFARMDNQFFSVYDNGEAPINRRVFMGMEEDVPTILLGAHGINPGVSVFGGTHLGFKHYAPNRSPLDWGGSWGMLEYKLDSGTSHISRLGFSQAGNIELIPHSATHLYKNVHVHGNPNAGQAWEVSASMGFFPTYIKNWSINAPLRGIKVHSHVIGSDNDNNIYCVSKSGEFSKLHAQIVNMQSARAAYSANISLARVFRDEAQVPVNLGESVEGLALAQKITLERQEEQEEAIICNLLASVEMYEMILETNPGIVNNEKRKSRIAAIYALLIKKDKLSIEDAPKCIVENVRKKLKESF